MKPVQRSWELWLHRCHSHRWVPVSVLRRSSFTPSGRPKTLTSTSLWSWLHGFVRNVHANKLIMALTRFLHFSHVQNIWHCLRIIHRRRHLRESRSTEDDGPVPVARGRRVAPYGVLDAGVDDLPRQLRHRVLRGDPLRQRR